MTPRSWFMSAFCRSWLLVTPIPEPTITRPRFFVSTRAAPVPNRDGRILTSSSQLIDHLINAVAGARSQRETTWLVFRIHAMFIANHRSRQFLGFTYKHLATKISMRIFPKETSDSWIAAPRRLWISAGRLLPSSSIHWECYVVGWIEPTLLSTHTKYILRVGDL